MVEIPILRAGAPYRSLNVAALRHFSSGEVMARVSQANGGLIARDLSQAERHRAVLREIPASDLLDLCGKAAQLFMESDLPLGEGLQSPRDYVRSLSATTGMPESLCRKNMLKISGVLERMRDVLGGLTRGLDPQVLDDGYARQGDRTLSYRCETATLGAVLPSNSPGVHSLWLPSIPLKIPLTLKPGGQEPWSPFRIAQSLMAAGCPGEAFGFYPTDYSGTREVLLRCGRSMLFGDERTVRPWKADPRVQIHGPGWSKVIIGEDKIQEWPNYIDLMVDSILDNGGRSCINASAVWVPSCGREVAAALAERLARVRARSLEDPEAEVAAFSSPAFARKLSELIDSQLARPGAADLTAPLRGNRFVEKDGAAFLLPTIVWCEDPGHPLAKVEYLFPFAAVVQVPQSKMLEELEPTLVATVITEDKPWIHRLLNCPRLERLNLGPVPTTRISWDQPHEGNLFELLYRQRALQLSL